MVRNRSATPLEAVQVALRGPVADVWLRRNIVEVEDTYDDGTTQVMWEADEVSGTVPAGMVSEIAGDFDAWWQRLEDSHAADDASAWGKRYESRIATLEEIISELIAGA